MVRYDETTGKIIVDSDFYENLEPGDYVINYIIHPLGVDGDDSNQVVPVKLTICAKDKAVISGLSAQDFNEGDNKSGVIGNAVVKAGEADITGDVSPLRYTYYTNKGLTNKTGTADDLGGAAYEGAVPTKEGTYYVKVDIEPDSKYTSEAVYRFSVLPLTEVSGHIDWDYRFNSKKDGEAKEYVLSGSDSRRSSRAEVVLLNHGEPVENKVEYVDITDTNTIYVESESVVDCGSGEYKFETAIYA